MLTWGVLVTCLAWFLGQFHWDYSKNLHGPLLLLEFDKCFNNGTHQFSLWCFSLLWPSFTMNWGVSSFVFMRTKSHLFFIASLVKSWSDSGSPTSHTLHWWLFSWRRSVPWQAQFPTLLDSSDSFVVKGTVILKRIAKLTLTIAHVI